ncbi:hypothetical protein R1sor_020820 [Riccia sorocarpa]|uniref:3'(2'),5'-bisphosphate nucleotidase n=1 Tax=Riccia sorocarpa TaxID=122646 RepID=A0ABD3GHD8_9MARC
MEAVSCHRHGSVLASMTVKTHRFNPFGKISSLRIPARLGPNQHHQRCCRTPVMIRCQSDFQVRVADSTYRRELIAAIDVVERACELCLSVQVQMKEEGSGFSSGGGFEKKDATPVTVADFGVQALVSLELSSLFPFIPLVGEEDTGKLRKDWEQRKAATTDSETSASPALIELVTHEVAKVASEQIKNLTVEKVMDAIDRGCENLEEASRQRNLSYWVLDPIDGTRGFLRREDAVYVVGLALVVEGKLVLGVMGGPNVSYTINDGAVPWETPRLQMATNGNNDATVQTGLLMAACAGCGCWVKPLQARRGEPDRDPASEVLLEGMIESKVDECMTLREAKFCISDHEVWSSHPLAGALASRAAALEDRVTADEADILPLCCGSLCKYFAVALGGASLFVLHLQEGQYVKVWDHAAGVICVTEAGGQVTNVMGKPVQEMIRDGQATFRPEGGGIVVANGRLGEKVTRYMSAVRDMIYVSDNDNCWN